MRITLRHLFILVCLIFAASLKLAAQSITTPVDNDGNANYVLANATTGTAVNVTASSTASGFNTNWALSKTVYVSSTEQASFPGSAGVDGNTTSTRWSSAFTDNEWMTVDLGATYDISEVKLYWEVAYGKNYKIQVSSDNSTWTTITTVTGGNGGIDDLTGLSGSGRYIRMLGTLRGTTYGFSLYEFQVYGSPDVVYSLTTNPSSIFQINSSTGVVSVLSGTSLNAGTYTITAKATSSTVNASANFTVTAVAAPTTTGGTSCGPGTATLTASDSPTGGTFNWYTAATAGSLLQSSTSTTYSPSIAATTNYYVSYTIGTVTTARTSVTATLGSIPILSTAPTTPTGGLYLSYPFSSNANDVSSNANNGTVQAAAPLTTDRYNVANSAYSFNGSTQNITTTKQVASPGPQNFSISVWFKTSTAGGKLVGYGSSQTTSSVNYDRQIYMTNAGQIYYGIYPNAVKTIGTASSYADGTWHHVVATTSTTAGSFLYIDGAVVAADATMTTSSSYAGYWRIGYDNVSGWTNSPTNSYFTGSLDDIAIYNTAISASQVYTLYGAGSAPTCVGSPLSLQANTVAGATYSWSGPGGYTSNSQNPTVSATATTANAGTYTLTVTSATGCVTTTTVTAVVNALPVATFTATSPVTVGSNSTITYTGTYAATSTYTWDFNSGTVASGSGVGPYTVNWPSSGTKTITLTVTNAAGCSSVSTQTVTVNTGNYGNYGFKKTVTLSTTSLGITSNLTNFPALLSIQDNNLIISNTCTDKVNTPNGPNYDFAFTDITGSAELYYQVESYNQTTGTLLVWVQIPTLTYATNNSILFFYGSPSPTVTHNTAFFQSTWGSDYKAVFHFNETTYSGSVADGTGGGHTGATSGMTSTDLVAGKIGNAYTYNGSSKKITSNAVTITGAFTISAWVKPTTVGVDQKIMTNQDAAGSSTGGYKFGIFSNNIPETESATAIDRGNTPTAPTFAVNTWHYVQGVYSGTNLSTYVDGVQYANVATTTSPSSTTPLYIGVGEGGSSYYFNGIIDEARVSNVAKTTDWLLAEYVNQNNPVTFTTAGSTTVISTNAAAVRGALTYTWKGVSSNPALATNWDNTTAGTTNQLPAFDGTATLVIPAGAAAYPTLTADVSLYGLTVAAGASINLGAFTLNVGCNIYNSSTTGQIIYSTSASGINWNGTNDQTYTGSSTSTATLGSMTINNTGSKTVTINGGPVDIYKYITITQGNLAVGASPAALTLKSSSTQTAYVTSIPSGSSITGSVNVERYISGGALQYRGYRFLSSPVYTAKVGTDYFFDLSYLSAYAPITGTIGTTAGMSKIGNPTIYLYRGNTGFTNNTFNGGNFRGVNKINNTNLYTVGVDYDGDHNLYAGTAFWFFYRGNTSNIATKYSAATIPEANVFVSKGTLNQQTVTWTDWYNGSTSLEYLAVPGNAASYIGYNMVGNPYPSSIDWDTYSKTNAAAGIYAPLVDKAIYIYNETIKTYGIYEAGTGGTGTNGASHIIPSGQGFFVQALATGGQVIFHESAKTNSQVTGPTGSTGSTLLLSTKPVKSADPLRQYMRLELFKDTLNLEETMVRFETGAKNEFVVGEDSKHMLGSGLVSFSSNSVDNIDLGINHIPLPKTSATVIKLNVSATADGQYAINRTELVNIPAIYEIWLKDAYKKDSLDFKNNSTYRFDILRSDTNSFGSRRFTLVIRENPALALHLLNFAAAKKTSGSNLVWKTENEGFSTNFTIERSADNGKTFLVVGGYASSNEGTYSLLDRNPVVGTDLYRLKMEDLNGTITYSKAMALVYSTLSGIASAPVSIYPNPAVNTINVSIIPSIKQLPIPVNVSYDIIITGSNGNVVQKAASTQTEWQGTVANLLPGSYIVQVINSKDKSVVGKSKFVKL